MDLSHYINSKGRLINQPASGTPPLTSWLFLLFGGFNPTSSFSFKLNAISIKRYIKGGKKY